MANEIYQDIVLSVKAENTDAAKKDLDSIANSMKQLSSYTMVAESVNKRQDSTTGKLSNTVRRKYVPSQALASKELKRFKMEALGTMFGGLALEKVFGKLTRAGFDMYQVGDLYNTTFGVLMLPVMEILGETIFGVADALMSLPDDAKLALGTVLLLGQGFGMLVGSMSTAILFMDSLQKIGGLGGLVKSFTEAGDFLGKYAGKALTTTVKFVTDFSQEFLAFFTPAGKWIMSKVKVVSDLLTGTIDKMLVWLFGADFASGMGGKIIKTTVSIAVTFATLDFATRLLSTIFSGLGEQFGKETTLGKVFIDLAVGTKDGYIGLLFDAYFRKLPILLNVLFDVGFKGMPDWFANLMKNVYSTTNPVMGISRQNEMAGVLIQQLFPGLFGMATGGIVTQPTTALIGEAGPEAVIPLNRLSEVTNSGQTVYAPNIEIKASVSSDYDVGRLAEQLNRYMYQDYARLKMI